MVSQWNLSGIFSKDAPHCSLSVESKSSCQWAKSQKISQDGSSSCRCSTTSHWDLKTIKRMRIKRQLRFCICKKIPTREMVIPRTWIRKEMVFYSRIQITRKMGQSSGANGDQIWRKRTPSFPCDESIVPRNAQEQRWWKIVSSLLR